MIIIDTIKEYRMWRRLGLRRWTSLRIIRRGFFGYVIDMYGED